MAGLFNTGTNALITNLQSNLGIPGNKNNRRIKRDIHDINGFVNEVPWWKHNPKFMEWRRKHDAEVYENILPIVLVRDPLFWRKSTCKSPYELIWATTAKGHCPSKDQKIKFGLRFVKGGGGTVEYDSLEHLWNKFYWDYLKADFPRLIVRFEDTLFYLPQIVETVKECVGAYKKHSQLEVQTGYAKKHGNTKEGNTSTNPLVNVMLKAVNPNERLDWIPEDDKATITETLDAELVSKFHYTMP